MLVFGAINRTQAGVFTNPNLLALYNDLVARGSQSLVEALKVGTAIEKIDILDLQERLVQIINTDIQRIFNNPNLQSSTDYCLHAENLDQ